MSRQNRLLFLYLIDKLGPFEPGIFVRSLKTFFQGLFLTVLIAIGPHFVFSQDRCGTVTYTEALKESNNLFEDTPQFEKWLQQKQKARRNGIGAQRTKSTYQIPVVFHIIHNGEATGVSSNISAAQIQSQLAVLNKDFKRLNTDATNTPAEFLPVAGAFDIEFVLAKQSPEGLVTDGIVRVQGTKTSWTMNDNYILKSLSYWPAEDYLNIWVVNLSDVLGYSQFPVSGLPGLENSSTNRLTDGVVISYTVAGSIDDGAFNLQPNFRKGRTATHEVGHFFGLRHIWGDDSGGCTESDYVDDTPNQGGSTSGCPAHPRTTCSGVTSMFQNFLDYTNDDCMNIFTQGQVERMVTVIENSPRRASLTTSPGLSDPIPVANDLGLKEIVSPQTGECATPFIPTVEIRNYGNNSITSARVRLKKDGVITETKNFNFNPALNILESTTITFTPISFASGNHNVTFEILQTNATTDGIAANNILSRDVLIPQSIAVPFLETFSSAPSTWTITNPDQFITWQLANTPPNGNKAIKMEFYNYEDSPGEIDMLITPVINLTSAPAALLKFDVAYARYLSSDDGLKVVLLDECNTNISQGVVVYDKSGASLATTASTSADFTPSNSTEWRNESIDLSAYIGQNNLQLAFIGINDYGNNLYLDNISLTTSPIYDIVLREVLAPSPVTCSNQVQPKLRIENAGTLVSSLKVVSVINGALSTQTFTGLNFPGNSVIEIELTTKSLIDGENEISFEVTEPDNETDFNPFNNEQQIKTIVNRSNNKIPLRENFEGIFDEQWVRTNPRDGMNWEPTVLDGNTSVFVDGFSNTTSGDQSWLVSPVLDFTDIEEASLTYDVSYAYRENTSDIFYILASTDCGTNFTDTLYTASGSSLTNGLYSSNSWQPQGEGDWTNKSHILATVVGKPDVRIAFVFVNDHGNNFYVDNIEFYVSDIPVKITEVFSVYPNPAADGNAVVSFNLPEKGTVVLDIIDPMGKVLISETLPDILNQTFPFSLSNRSSGVYLVRVKTGDNVYFKRLIVMK